MVSLFRQRGFAIDSLTIGKTHEPHVMRLTMVVDGSKTAVEQVVKQLYKVIEVRKVSDLTDDQTVEREPALIKVTSKTSALRAEILQMVDVYRARVVDIAMGSLTVEVTGPADKIDSMVSMLGRTASRRWSTPGWWRWRAASRPARRRGARRCASAKYRNAGSGC